MKKFLPLLFLLFSVSFAQGVQNQYTGIVIGKALDGSMTSIPTSFGTSGAALYTGLSGKTHIIFFNNTAAIVAVSIGTTATNCSGGTDDIYVPSGGGAGLDDVTINSNVCVRSLGSALATGVVYASVW